MELKSEQWLQVKEIFQAALEMDPSSRQVYLSREELPPALRALASNLFNAHAEAGSFLEHQALFAAELGTEPVPPPRLSEGMVLLERFRVLRFLARGGMGEVYEAEDMELRARVALKTIRAEIAGIPGAFTRFKREVALARQVTHPNVCRIFDLFCHRGARGGDISFLSMELLEGPTLAARLRRGGALDTDTAVTILLQVASALEAAHAAGILHRDLKPGNIMLEARPEGAIRAVITDFGMAWSRVSSLAQSLTGGGQAIFGTPQYMSPEQLEGKALTAASDIYALGLVTYQTITGERAFEGDTPLITALRRLTEDAPLPSRTHPQLVDPQWDQVVARCLDRNPAHRFASAAEYAATITRTIRSRQRGHRLLRHELVRMKILVSAHRVVSAALATVCILLGIAAVVYSHRSHPPAASGNLTLVLADFVNTTGDPVFDDTLNTALNMKLQQSPFLNLMPDARIQTALRYIGAPANGRLTRTLAEQVCAREGGQAVLQGTISPGSDGYDLWLRAYDCASGKLLASQGAVAGARDSALTALDEAANGMRVRLGESMGSMRRYNVPLVDASTPSLQALTAYSKGLRVSNQRGQVAAEPDFLRAVQIDPEFAIAYARLSSIDADMGEPAQARVAAIRAYERRDRVSEWERFFILSCYYAFATGELDKERATYRAWGSVYPHDTVWPTGLMIDDSYFGAFDQAAEMARLQIRNAPETAAAYGNLAEIYLAEERPDEAAAILDQAAQAHLHEINLDWERYLLDFYNQDAAGMDSVAAHGGDYPGLEETLLELQASTQAYAGRMHASHALMQRAREAAILGGDAEGAAMWQAKEALWEAEYGMKPAARADLAQALAAPAGQKSKDVEILSALAAATVGEESETQALITRLEQAFPEDSLLHQYWLPSIRARVALDRGNPAAAIKLLKSTAPFETGIMDPMPAMHAVYIRALAQQAEGDTIQAAASYRLLIAHRGLVLNEPIGALARLGLARVLARQHDSSGSRVAYKNLLETWKGADPGLALPRLAAHEYGLRR